MTDCRGREEHNDPRQQEKDALSSTTSAADSQVPPQASEQERESAYDDHVNEHHRQVSPMVDGGGVGRHHLPYPGDGYQHSHYQQQQGYESHDHYPNSPPYHSNEVPVYHGTSTYQQPTQAGTSLCIASPVTMEEARLAASRMKQLSSHYQNATLNSPTPTPSPGASMGPPLTKFTAIAPKPEGRPCPRPERVAIPRATTNAALYPIPIAAAPPKIPTISAPEPSTVKSIASPVPTEQGYYASQSSQMQEAKYQDTTTESNADSHDGTAERHPFVPHPRKRPHHASTYGSIPTTLSQAAHRRTMSNRATAYLQQQHQQTASGRNHYREDSAGLDILSAAVEGISQDELAAVAGSGQKPQHRRDESLMSAFGSLGSVDFKNLLNNVSTTAATPDKKELEVDPTASSARDHIGNATPSETTLAPTDRAPTPPTPMISNINRQPKDGTPENQPKKAAPSIPVFKKHQGNEETKGPSSEGGIHAGSVNTAQVSDSTGNKPGALQLSHIQHPPPTPSQKGSMVPETCAAAQPTQMPDLAARQEAARPLKKQHRRHRSSFSNLFNGMASSATVQPPPPPPPQQRHTRDPSETAKMLMQIERKIDQDVVAKKTPDYHHHPVQTVSGGTIASPESLSSPPNQQQLSYTRHPPPTHVRSTPLYPPGAATHRGGFYVAAPVAQVATGPVQVCTTPKSYHYPTPPPPPPVQQQGYYPPPPQPHNHAGSRTRVTKRRSPPPPLASTERNSMPPPPVLMSQPPPPEASPLSKKLMGHSSPIGGPPAPERKTPAPQQAQRMKDSSRKASPETVSNSASKRVRRKCAVPNCQNRVVQGGRCITHGAKRKQCGHPGCTKNVKKAGMCSTHGPARKRCEAEGCNKVAVQGGRCITHGARKKLCSVQNCEKQGIINGYCKKHYDEVVGGRNRKPGRTASTPIMAQENHHPQTALITHHHGTAGATTPIKPRGNGSTRVVRISSDVASSSTPPSSDNTNNEGGGGKPSHKRGLSVFYDMSAVEAITSEEAQVVAVEQGSSATATTSGYEEKSQKKKAHERGLSIFSDENVSNAIISGALNDTTIS